MKSTQIIQKKLGFGILAIAIAGGLLCYGYYRIKNKPSPPKKLLEQKPKQQQTLLTSCDEIFDKQAQLDKIVHFIDISEGPLLNFQDIKSIFNYSLDIIKDEYFKLTKEIRKRRRLIRKIYQDQYLKIILEYEDQVNQLIQRGREQLVEALQIPLEKYHESLYQLQHSQYREEFILLQQSTSRRLKQKLLKKRRLSDETATQILKHQMKFLSLGFYQRYQQLLKKKNVNEVQIQNTIQTIIEDVIYQNYGYEQEHMIMKLSDQRFFMKQQIKQLTEDIKKENVKLLGRLAGFKNMQAANFDDE